jgi:hypothetical protein
MTNGGWHGTNEEWNRIEAPLKMLDADLDLFSRNQGLIVTKNVKDWPERSLIWGAEVRCLIQIFLANESMLSLNFWICASQDRDKSRFWKNEMLRKEIDALEMARDLKELLETGKRQLDDWSDHPEQLEFATNLLGPI